MRAERSDRVASWFRRASRARPGLPLLSLAAGLLAALGIGDAALGVTPVGSEFQVNTYTTDSQWGPSVAADADGNFVVVWTSAGSAGSDTDGDSVQGQRYDASGNAAGSEFQVNTYTTGGQANPSVAVDADGDFVVVWESDGSAGSDTSGLSIQGQRYDASGNPVASQFQVNTHTTLAQLDPSVAADADGDFVVVWTGPAIQGQRYDASGNPLSSQFQVFNSGSYPSVAADADGDFVVAWTNYVGFQLYKLYHVLGRRYDASGNAVGSAFQISTNTGQRYGQPTMRPSVATDADGDFVVVWDRWGGMWPYGGYEVKGQRYDASGSAVGSEFGMDYVLYYRPSPSVAARAGGDFVVVWDHNYFGYRWIGGEHYDADGNALDTFQVENSTYAYVSPPAVAVDGNGGFVVVWGSDESAGSDTSSWSIQGQRYTVQAPGVPALGPPGVIGLTALLLGIAAAVLRGRLPLRG